MRCELQRNINSAPENFPVPKKIRNIFERVSQMATVQHHADGGRHQAIRRVTGNICQIGHRVPKDNGSQLLEPAVHQGAKSEIPPFTFSPGAVTFGAARSCTGVVVNKCLDDFIKRDEAFRFCEWINHAFPNAAPQMKCRADQVGRLGFLPSE